MGVNLFVSSSSYSRSPGASSSSYDRVCPAPITKGNPDPNDYKFIKVEEHKNFLVVKINYPNCNNYEGNKILVYKNTKLLDLVNQKSIDPHFCNNPKFISPIARFVPTEEGWNMAVQFCKIAGT